MRGSSFLSLVVFVLILVAINLIAAAAGWDFRVSIIGSLVLTLIISGILSLFRRGRTSRG